MWAARALAGFAIALVEGLIDDKSAGLHNATQSWEKWTVEISEDCSYLSREPVGKGIVALQIMLNCSNFNPRSICQIGCAAI